MSLDDFLTLVRESDSPAVDLSEALCALWHAEKGNWDQAHDLAQAMDNVDGCIIHANLHREEGDIGNANYWYKRANATMPSSSVVEERHDLIRHYLNS
jgi:hypothetical protein